MRYVLAVIGMVFLASAAHAAEAVCPDLTALQRWAGYLSWMGFLKVCAVAALAVGIGFFFYGFFKWVWEFLWSIIRNVADVLAHAASVALIVAGSWTPEAYQLWPVLGGCLLFGGSVMLTIWLRELKGENPIGVFGILTIVWGAVALYYQMPEVGFITVMAFMGVLGFSVIVTPLCYGFGFREKENISSATASALIVLAAYAIEHIFFAGRVSALKVFESGAFWMGSLVGFLGLLLLSSKWVSGRGNAHYGWLQLVTVVCYLAGIGVGMTFGINPLAGIAGTFLVFYFAEKLMEVETHGAMAFGFKLMLIGGVFSGAWFFASKHEAVVKTYLTMTLPG